MIEAYEDKLDGEKAAYLQLKKDKEQVIADFAEVRRQHEEDQDQEIEVTKTRYDIFSLCIKTTSIKSWNNIMYTLLSIVGEIILLK